MYSGIDNNYREIEKRLIALRYLRSKKEGNFEFYLRLSNFKEIYTCCNRDWYLTLFDDGTIDGFVVDDDERAREEYERALKNIYTNKLGNMKKKRLGNK